MIYKGREVVAYRLEEFPIHVIIDVLQNDSDCPRKLSRDERLLCPLDCQNTFLSFKYDAMERKIIGEGALAVNSISVDSDALKEVGVTYEECKKLAEKGAPEVGYVKDGSTTSLLYKGIVVAQHAECVFHAADKIEHLDTASAEYADLVRKDPEKVLEACGIKINGDGNVTLMVTSSEDNVKSLQDMENPNREPGLPLGPG